MSVNYEDFGYKEYWDGIQIGEYSGYKQNMADYHRHTYYEISLIVSGDVTVLTSAASDSGKEPRVLFFRPGTPHFVQCSKKALYKRININFSPDSVFDAPEHKSMLEQVFTENGRIVRLEPAECDSLVRVALDIKKEKNEYRQKLLLLYFISLATDRPNKYPGLPVPAYVTEVMAYINTNYGEKITAEGLAERFFVGRTTLMTAFKKHTGTTVNDYIVRLRIKKSVSGLLEYKSVQTMAIECGFGSSSNMIKTFRRYLDMTPVEYANKIRQDMLIK